MKFIYVDESGGRDQHDVFTMCGLMVDAYKLRKKTEDFDRLLEGIYSKYPGVRKDLKTISSQRRWRLEQGSRRREKGAALPALRAGREQRRQDFWCWNRIQPV